MGRVHTRFDLQRWVREFPLEGARAEVRAWVEECDRERPYPSQAAKQNHIEMMMPQGDIIVGPEHVALMEQLRSEAGAVSSYGPAVATDIMVWAKGEPEHPATTKLGGRPFRPAGKPWPAEPDGTPRVFLGQVCFAESRDVLADERGGPIELPGDVLVMFMSANGVWDNDDEDPDALSCEWYPLALGDLAGSDEVPDQGAIIPPCHAQLHRTVDYPDVPEEHPIRRHRDCDQLCVLEGGKIGGVPHFVQHDLPRPGVFLGALGSVNPVGPRYPLLNVPVNPDGKFNMPDGFMMFGDCGSLYLFLDLVGPNVNEPKVRWTVQGY